MPALPPVPAVLRCALYGFVDNTDTYRWGNVIHFGYTGTAPSNGTCAAIATEFSTMWGTHMSPEQPSPTTLAQVLVTDLTSNTSGEGEWLGTVAGTRGDDSIAANAAMLISYVSPIRYRGGHPRQYLYIGGNADFSGAAEWSTAFTAEGLAHWKAFVEAMLGYTVSGCTLSSFCTISYTSKEVNPTPPYRRTTPLVLSLDITSCTSAQEIASQRRRIGRRKR